MKQKTVRLENHRIGPDGRLEYLRPCYVSPDDREWRWVDTELRVGSLVTLASVTDVSPNARRAGTDTPSYYLAGPNGVASNSDHTILSHSGWRGTTNDRAVYAHGLRRITNIRTLRSGDVAVTVGGIVKEPESAPTA